MSAKFKFSDNKIIIQGDINFETVSAIYSEIENYIISGNNIVIDFSETKEVNSAALALIIELKKLANKSKVDIKFSKIPDKLLRLAEASNLVSDNFI